MSLLAVDNLSVIYASDIGSAALVKDVSFTLERGATLGIVGESGSGKTMTALALMSLLPAGAHATGRIRFDGEDLAGASEARLCELRGNRFAMVFQEPMTALNPVHRVGDQVAEGLVLHRGVSHAAARAEAVRLLARVGIANAGARAAAYPHELSGGQRQRVVIAMALACGPELIIADEPTSALDVTVQAQIVRLLRAAVDELDIALILISHDLGLVGQLADRVMVMYAGSMVEEGPTAEIFRRRAHPYTQGLFAALPTRAARKGRRLVAIPGVVPSPFERGPGCAFFGRCPKGVQQCRVEPLPVAELSSVHRARCLFPEGPS